MATDYLAAARAAAADAEEYVIGAQQPYLARVQAYATLALAEALERIAAATDEAPVDVDQDALVQKAAARIDAIGDAGKAGPWVHAASALGLDYAEHWRTAVAVDTVLEQVCRG